MALKMKAHDAETLVNEIRRAEENGDFTPNDWEDKFLTSIRNQINAGTKSFSDKQQGCLDKIYHKSTEEDCYR